MQRESCRQMMAAPRLPAPVWVPLLLLLCAAAAAPAEARRGPRFRDPAQPVAVRVASLLKRMTLAEKIGQMTQIERTVASADVMRKHAVGSVLSAGGSVPRARATAKDWVDMVNEFQKGSMSTRLKIPMLYGVDAVHGHNNVYNATIFPHNIGLGVTRDADLVRRIGEATALEVRATGIPYVFAPCIAVCRDLRWGRCYESYSEDHKIVVNMTSIILGLQGDAPNRRRSVPFVGGSDKVAACAKHFVGDGGTTKGVDEGNTVITPRELMHNHMFAYFKAVQAGVSTVMVSYSSINGVKMHANRDLITGVLKDRLRFQGIVISDWQAIDQITSPPGANYTYSVLTSINAGLDMIMVPYDYTGFIGNLTYLVEKNFIPMSRIDDAVSRILRVKFSMGLFEKPYADLSLADKIGHPDHRELAREAVRRSLVLLKNGKTADEKMIPLPKNAAKILVAGSHADNLGYQCGGWTIAWQGVSGNNVTAGTTILDGIKKAVSPSTEVVFSEDVPDAGFVKNGGFSYAVVVVGETPYAEIQGDSDNLTLPERGVATMQNVCGAVRCVVVLVTGRPVVMRPHVPQIDALVAAWLPGSEGQGVADLLFGDFGFTGTLAFTWFNSVDQLPLNYGDANYTALYRFGYGLTTAPAAS